MQQAKLIKVVGIKFKKNPKTYYFDPLNFEYALGDGVVLETARGVEFGVVTALPFEVKKEEIIQPLKPVLRKASDEDAKQSELMELKAKESIKIADEKIKKSCLDMNLSDAEYTLDGTKLILYFTSDNRVDFRDLVKELAHTFKSRIELRQIGSRDECKIKGGLGPCGRACCCSVHLKDFEQSSIKMAKNQGLSLNPQKISGLCGRLMCCLSYENKHYQEVNKRMPKMGAEAVTSGGLKGIVAGIHHLKETITLKIYEKDVYRFESFPLKEVKFKGKSAAMDSDGESEEGDKAGGCGGCGRDKTGECGGCRGR
ncbi:MAG: stage 0 sporulation family protein [Firmicutes bacterium]|nr:stage 0 sporulation family protein [Bacillota bacterium]